MKTFCKVTVLGHVGADPEVRFAPNGNCVATFNVYTNERWKDRDTGTTKEHSERHRVVTFGRTAEIVRDYLKKGNPVLIEGKLQTRKWQDKDKVDRYTTEIVGNEINLLASAPGNGAGHAASPQQPQTAGDDSGQPEYEPNPF